MGIKINHNGLQGLYAKVGQVNVKNAYMKETIENPDDGTITVNELATRPMDVIVHVYAEQEKIHKQKSIEFTGVAYDPTADDKDPVNQAYTYIKTQLDVVEDNV